MVNRELIYQIISDECALSYGYVFDNQEKIVLTPEECYAVVSKAFDYAGIGQLEPKKRDRRDVILEAVCDYFSVEVGLVKSKSQKHIFARPRYYAARIMRSGGMKPKEIYTYFVRGSSWMNDVCRYVDNLDVVGRADFNRLEKFVQDRNK